MCKGIYCMVSSFTFSILRLKQNLFGLKSFTAIPGGRFFNKHQIWPRLCPSFIFWPTMCLSLASLLYMLKCPWAWHWPFIAPDTDGQCLAQRQSSVWRRNVSMNGWMWGRCKALWELRCGNVLHKCSPFTVQFYWPCMLSFGNIQKDI